MDRLNDKLWQAICKQPVTVIPRPTRFVVVVVVVVVVVTAKAKVPNVSYILVHLSFEHNQNCTLNKLLFGLVLLS